MGSIWFYQIQNVVKQNDTFGKQIIIIKIEEPLDMKALVCRMDIEHLMEKKN